MESQLQSNTAAVRSGEQSLYEARWTQCYTNSSSPTSCVNTFLPPDFKSIIANKLILFSVLFSDKFSSTFDFKPVRPVPSRFHGGKDFWAKPKLFLLFLTLSCCNSTKSLQILPWLANLWALPPLFLCPEMEEIRFAFHLYFGRNVPLVPIVMSLKTGRSRLNRVYTSIVWPGKQL